MLVIATPVHAATRLTVDPIDGFWRTQDGDGVIEMYECGDQICGRFHWLQDDSPANVARDTENPDPARRARPLCGLQFMGGFRLTPAGRYEGGWIYNPQNGAVYSARMTLMDKDTLNLHGYVLTPLLGQSQIWKRTNATPACVTEHL